MSRLTSSNRAQLVGCFLVREGGFELLLQRRVGGVAEPGPRLALCVQLYQLASHLEDLFPGALLELLPGVAAELVEQRRFPFRPGVLAQPVELLHRDEQLVLPLVDDLQAVVVASAQGQPANAPVASDPMVDVNDEVADGKGVARCDRSGCLETPVAVALFAAAEDLVIVEHRDARFREDEAAIQRPQPEGKLVRTVVQDFLQPARLPLCFGEEVDLVPLALEGLQLLPQHGEFSLHEAGLAALEAERAFRGAERRLSQPAFAGDLAAQPAGVTRQRLRRQDVVAVAAFFVVANGGPERPGDLGLELLALVAEQDRFVEVLEETVVAAVEERHEGLDSLQGAPELELVLQVFEVDLVFPFRLLDGACVLLEQRRVKQQLGSRQHTRLFHPAQRALGGDVELADGLDLVPEELEAQGLFEAEGEDVDDAAPDAELPCSIDHRNALEPGVDQVRGEASGGPLFSRPQRQSPVLEGMRRDHRCHQGGGRGDGDGGLPRRQLCHCFDPQPGYFLGWGAAVVEADVPGREVAHHTLAGDCLQVVAPVFGAVFIAGDYQQRPVGRPLHVGCQEGCERRRQSVQKNLPLPLLQAPHGLLEGGGQRRLAGDVVEERCRGHRGDGSAAPAFSQAGALVRRGSGVE